MPRAKFHPVLGFVVFAALAWLWHAVHVRFGQTEGFRVWGAAGLVVSVILTFRDEIPVYLGKREVARLKGSRKLYALAPFYFVFIVVAVFPHEVACAVRLKAYVCA